MPIALEKTISIDDPLTLIDVAVTNPPLTSTVNALVGAVIGDNDSLNGIVIVKPSVLTVGDPLRVGAIASIEAPVSEPPPVSASTGCGVDIAGPPVTPIPISPNWLSPRHWIVVSIMTKQMKSRPTLSARTFDMTCIGLVLVAPLVPI